MLIPKGKVTTYGILAKAMGRPKAYRYAGNLLGRNPYPDEYPCYKVVKGSGEIGGYSGKQDVKEKTRRLRKDGVIVERGRIAQLGKFIFNNF